MLVIVKDKLEFNKENLLKIYKILSNNCLDEKDELKEGAFYRDDVVSIGEFDGAPVEMIDEYTNSLFAFVND